MHRLKMSCCCMCLTSLIKQAKDSYRKGRVWKWYLPMFRCRGVTEAQNKTNSFFLFQKYLNLCRTKEEIHKMNICSDNIQNLMCSSYSSF